MTHRGCHLSRDLHTVGRFTAHTYQPSFQDRMKRGPAITEWWSYPAPFCHLVSTSHLLPQNDCTLLFPPRLKAIPDITEWPCHAFATLPQSYTRYHRMAVPCFCNLVSKLYPISQNGCAMLLPPCFKAIPDITEWPCHAASCRLLVSRPHALS